MLRVSRILKPARVFNMCGPNLGRERCSEFCALGWFFQVGGSRIHGLHRQEKLCRFFLRVLMASIVDSGVVEIASS